MGEAENPDPSTFMVVVTIGGGDSTSVTPGGVPSNHPSLQCWYREYNDFGPTMAIQFINIKTGGQIVCTIDNQGNSHDNIPVCPHTGDILTGDGYISPVGTAPFDFGNDLC